MSFWKAEQLLALATLVAARHAGVTLDDVMERFSVSKRTAQRMLRALEAQFTDTNVSTDGDGRKRWRNVVTIIKESGLRADEIGERLEPLGRGEIPHL